MIVYTDQVRKYLGKTRQNFNLARYMGPWYDVAHKPFKYQAACETQSQAFYQMQADGTVAITNVCGSKVAKAVAKMVGNDDMRFLVDFSNGQPPGEYWIVMVDSLHYKWAVVSNSSRSLLWILSRTASLAPTKIRNLLAMLQKTGYDISDLQFASKTLTNVKDVEMVTINNKAFRRVLASGPHLQLVLMSLEPGTEIGAEVHKTTDQFFRIEGGYGVLQYKYSPNDPWTNSPIRKNAAILVPAGVWHNIKASSRMAFYTLYAPPKH